MEVEELLDHYEKIVFVAVGDVLKGDDGIGVYLCQQLNETERLKIVIAEMAPENYIKPINEHHPDVIVFVDAVAFNKEPGYTHLIKVQELEDQTTHTHNISLQRFSVFFDAPVYVLGIQPSLLTYGLGFSEEVKKSALDLIDKLSN